jgi:Domain of unknown function (DUF4337)
MAIDQVKEVIATDKETRDKWIGVYIGVVAVLLALCGMLGGNAAKDATRAHIEAANVWNFFQAKNLRRNAVRLAGDEFELKLIAEPGLPDAAKAKIAEKIKSYKDLDARLTSDKASNEGLDELFQRGKELEKERDIALRKDPYFDWAQALLQIAIVLATVCLVTGTFWLLSMSAGLAALGALLMINGAVLFVAVPGIG